MTHTAFQAVVAYSVTCTHCETNTPPSGTVPHVLLSQHPSCQTHPKQGTYSTSYPLVPTFAPYGTTFHPNQMAPETCWRGGGAARLKAVTA